MDTELIFRNRASRRVMAAAVLTALLSTAADWLIAGRLALALCRREIADLLSVSGGGKLTAPPDPAAIAQGEALLERLGITAGMDPRLLSSYAMYRGVLFGALLAVSLVAIAIPAAVSLYEQYRLFRQIEALRDACASLPEHLPGRIPVQGEPLGSLCRACEAADRMAVQLSRMQESLELERTLQKDFLTDFSHQMKTSLAVVRLDSDMLGELSLPPERQAQLAGTIALHLDGMEQLVLSALRYARIRADAVVYEKETADLAQTCREAFRRLSPLLEREGIEAFPPQGEALLRHDRAWLCEAVENLLMNAAGHSGCTQLRAELRVLSGAVKLIITDNGAGIPQSEIPHLFERFQKKSHGRETNFGVGLSIAKKVVEAHDGAITVYSGSGTGTSFELLFLT